MSVLIGDAPQREVQRRSPVGSEFPEGRAAPFADVQQVQIAENEARDPRHQSGRFADPVRIGLAGVERDPEKRQVQVPGLADHRVDPDLLVRDGAGARVEGGEEDDRPERPAAKGPPGQEAVLAAAPEENVDRLVGSALGSQPGGLLAAGRPIRQRHRLVLEGAVPAPAAAAGPAPPQPDLGEDVEAGLRVDVGGLAALQCQAMGLVPGRGHRQEQREPVTPMTSSDPGNVTDSR